MTKHFSASFLLPLKLLFACHRIIKFLICSYHALIHSKPHTLMIVFLLRDYKKSYRGRLPSFIIPHSCHDWVCLSCLLDFGNERVLVKRWSTHVFLILHTYLKLKNWTSHPFFPFSFWEKLKLIVKRDLLEFLYPCYICIRKHCVHNALLVRGMCTGLNKNLEEANHCFRKYIHFTNYFTTEIVLVFIVKWKQRI